MNCDEYRLNRILDALFGKEEEVSINVALDEEVIAEIATTRGWGEFTRWVAKEHDKVKGGYPALVHLTSFGWEDDIESVEKDLRKCVAQGKPSKDVKSVADGLLRCIKGEKDKVIVITDGLTSSVKEEKDTEAQEDKDKE